MESAKKISKKYSKRIERIKIRGKLFYLLIGLDVKADDDINLILLKDKKILLFKNFKQMNEYIIRNRSLVFDYNMTSKFINQLVLCDSEDINKWLMEFKVIDITFLQNILTAKYINYDNRKLHSIVFNFISLLSDYFWQINDKKNYIVIKSNKIDKYFDLYLDDQIFSNKLNEKINNRLSEILNSENFKKIIFNSSSYFEILTETF